MAMNAEEVAMMLIVHSGDARTLAFRALTAAREGRYDEAKKLLTQSEEKALEAHHVQTGLLAAEAGGEGPELNILLVHSQDHLMTSMLAQELIKELIYLHEKKADKQ
ncbi:MAG: PTS lactose/cellobiose transporter subunit IIA [Lachnospiraceae bacterium]|jgi:PTS system cellobiose-specific IIA component|nr:PTS lactose/cellobiose transporter subunit IIA [Lachnospiraceae bacterium]